MFIESDLSTIKDEIIEVVANTADRTKLVELQNFLARDKLQPLIKTALHNKLGSSNGHEKDLFNLFLTDKFTLTEKINLFNEVIINGGVFDGEELLRYSYANLYKLIENKNALLNYHSTDISKIYGKLKYSSGDTGPVEFLLALFGKNISFSQKSDLLISNKTVEVKATIKNKSGASAGGRLSGTSGYGSPTTVRDRLQLLLISLGIPEEELIEHGMYHGVKSKIIGGLNLNNSGLDNLNRLIRIYSNQDGCKKIFSTILNGLYTNIPTHYIDEFLKNINDDGSFNVSKIQRELAKVAFNYYKLVEHHDCIMFVNADSGFFGIAHTDKDLDLFFDKKFLKLTSHITWSDDFGKGSAQFIFSYPSRLK